MVVALVGLPGAGKSIVAHHLVRELGLRLVSRDAIRAAMFPDCRYTITEKRGAFRAVLTAIEVNAALGASSVVDGMTFAKRSDLDRVAETCRRSGVRPTLTVPCACACAQSIAVVVVVGPGVPPIPPPIPPRLPPPLPPLSVVPPITP